MNNIHQYPTSSARRQRGLSLVELLVALAIGLLLVTGVIQLFIGSKQTYRFHDALSRIQENGRFALEVMARDIRMAGNYGCLPASQVADPIYFKNRLNDPNNYFWNFGQPLQGFESTGAGVWAPALDASITTPFAGGNVDVITIRSADGPGAVILEHSNNTGNPRVPTGSSFENCDLVVAANCRDASVFQVISITPVPEVVGPPNIPAGLALTHTTGGVCGPGNAANDLLVTFTPALGGGEVARVSTKSYYIRTGASGSPALWQRVGANAAQELVEGVERMEIRYGVCTGTDAARRVNPPYVNANDVANWADVCSVRIDLLMVSLENNLVTIPQTVAFPADTGSNVAPGDRRLRQGFSTTVGIRNRLP